MTATEVRQQAEIDRLKAALRSIAEQCDAVMRVRWQDPWEVVARVGNIRITAEKMAGPPANDEE